LQLAGEQQRQRLRRLRRDELLGRVRHGRALPRALGAAARRPRTRRRAGAEEDRARLGGDVPHGRGHAPVPARRRDRPPRPPGALARADRRRAVAMTRTLVSSAIAVVLLTLVFGFAYPLVMTGFAQVAFQGKANGSLITRDGKVVGSRLAGQEFTSADYFHGRP